MTDTADLEKRLTTRVCDMSDADLLAERERLDDEVRTRNERIRLLNYEVWLRQLNRDMRLSRADADVVTDQGGSLETRD